MDEKLIEDFLEKRNVFAVVGASRNHRKYGHQVYMDLRNGGYEVYPVNPNADKILGGKCYPSLESLPRSPQVVDLVVPPKVTNQIVKACKKLGIEPVCLRNLTNVRFCNFLIPYIPVTNSCVRLNKLQEIVL